MKKPKPPTYIKMMSYKAATANTSSMKKDSTRGSKIPRQSCEDYTKMIETAEFQKRANIQMNEVVDRFINYKKQELRLEDYGEEEIESIIETMLNFENDEYDDYSSDEDNDSVYSDEESF